MGKEAVSVDRVRMEEVVGMALEARKSGESLISRDKMLLPEAGFVKLVREWGEKTGNEAFAVTAVFLATMFDFGGSSGVLFKNIANPDQFSKYSWLFEPKLVVQRNEQEVEQACKDYFGPGGYNIYRSAPDYWHNCMVLTERYGGDVRNLFKECGDDAVLILKKMDTKSRQRNKAGLRRFGPKLGPMALERVAQWNLYTLKNMDKFDVPVDRHKARILVRTWALILEGEVNMHWTNMEARKALGEVCENNKWLPSEVSGALFIIGSKLCRFGRHDECPLAKECKIRQLENLGGRIDKHGKFEQVQDYWP